MEFYKIAVISIFVGIVLLEIIFTNFFVKPNQKPQDAIVETASFIYLQFLIQPLAFFIGYGVGVEFFPEYKDLIVNWNVFLVILLFLIFDDMAQYWWHRTCHNVPLLYNLHRPHHEAEYMSIRIVFRNNPIYFLLMPGLYFSGILVFLGGLKVYAFYIIIKQAVIFGAHTDLRWDKKLYEIKFLQPLMWLLERTISTPATHWAHHGKHMVDPATHYKGNYGNLLFLWDIIFGTAKITRKYPQEIGVENLNEASAAYQILWPFVKAPEKNQ